MKTYSLLVKLLIIILISNTAYAARIGVFTGTFDPPHEGHKDTVQRAIEYGNLDIIYVETSIPEYKPNALPYDNRIEMLEYVFRSIPQFKVAPDHVRALFKSNNYTDAIRQLLNIHEGDTFFRIIGSDKLSGGYFLSMDDTKLQYIVNPRDPSELTLPYAPTILNRPQTILLPPSTFQTSSTEMRNDAAKGIRNEYLDPYIYKKIISAKAYGSGSCKSLL